MDFSSLPPLWIEQISYEPAERLLNQGNNYIKRGVIIAVVHALGILILNTMGYLLCKTSSIMFAVKILYVSIPFAAAINAVFEGWQRQTGSREIRNNIETVNNCLRWIIQHFEPTENSYALRQSFASLEQYSIEELNNHNIRPHYDSFFYLELSGIYNNVSDIYLRMRENFVSNKQTLTSDESNMIAENIRYVFVYVNRYVNELNLI